MLVLRHCIDLIVTTDPLSLIIKSDRSEFVVTTMTHREIAKEVHGFQMKQIAMEEIFTETDNKITS